MRVERELEILKTFDAWQQLLETHQGLPPTLPPTEGSGSRSGSGAHEDTP